MKYKKVMALLISAGLSAGSLTSCSLQPQTAFGMEAEAETEAGEVNTDGTEEKTQGQAAPEEDPADGEGEDTQDAQPVQEGTVENNGPDAEGTASESDVGGEVVEQEPPGDESGGTGQEDRKSTRLNSSHPTTSRMPSSA